MLSLEQILEVVKEKYDDAYIDKFQDCIVHGKWKSLDNSNDGFQTVEDCGINNIYFKKINNNTIEEAFYVENNIIELKHYLDIEIKWKDILEYARPFIKKQHANCFELVGNIAFFLNGSIRTISNHIEDYTIAINRSYWQIYNIIKNLVE